MDDYTGVVLPLLDILGGQRSATCVERAESESIGAQHRVFMNEDVIEFL